MSLLLFLTACQQAEKNDTAIGDSDMVCEELIPVECEDDLILELGLQDTISEGGVSTTLEGNDFITSVDATAGGYQNAASNPWIYIKFTDQGAQKVDISDEDALESADWDMSLKRFLVRLNGGDSGPSCVGAAVFLEESYASLTSVPDGISYVLDDYYTADCSFINDSSGLPDSPQTAMSPWWEYPGCVATTGYPFIIQLADSRLVKLVVESYYAENQENCNTNGAMGSGSANFSLRWTFLD